MSNVNKKDDQTKDKELAECQEKMEEYLNGWKRAKADYINFKKEQETKQSELIQFANSLLIIQLLPIANNFKKALNHVPEEEKDNQWVEGLKNIKKQLDDFLKNLGVEEIKTIGEKFDPEKHEAISKKKINDKEADIIVGEAEGGYSMHGKVLIAAKVVVNE